MGLKYTRVPTDTWEKLVINAGVIAKWSGFNPDTGELETSSILGATSGGIQFATNPNYTDFGEDVDNVHGNTMQLKRRTGFDPTASGTFLTLDANLVAALIGAADVATGKVTPREQLTEDDFADIVIIGDYSDANTGANAGYLAIRLKRALNTAGFQLQTSKDAKGTMAFEFHAHYDIEDQDDQPFEVYVKSGTTSGGIPSVRLSEHVITIPDEGTFKLSATVRNSTQTVTWASGSDSVATVSGGVVTGAGTGNTIITASITDNGVTYNDTCTVIVTA